MGPRCEELRSPVPVVDQQCPAGEARPAAGQLEHGGPRGAMEQQQLQGLGPEDAVAVFAVVRLLAASEAIRQRWAGA